MADVSQARDVSLEMRKIKNANQQRERERKGDRERGKNWQTDVGDECIQKSF